MTQGVFRERIAFLRRRIAAIEAREGFRPLVETGRRTGAAPAAPFEGLLQELGAGGFCEIVPARPSAAAAAAGFAVALALRAAALRRRGVVWIAEEMAAREIGLPYGVGLQALGLDPERLILVRARSGAETLWAMEEALKSRAAAILAESWVAPSAYGLNASRRLLLAQRRGGGLGLLLLLRAAGEARRLSSATPLRFEVAPAPPRLDARLPPPAPPVFRLRVAKARAGCGGLGSLDPSAWRDIAFDPDEAEFHAFRERFPVAPVDRSAAAPKRRAWA
ncbi:MAG TPA: hypothetical protein VK446_14915 [Methylocystis sp.]|nr:hypothetical protein [Methylocystis sp.]